MSVTEIDKIDGMGIKESKELALLITDHLSWEDEYKHLLMLQKKINSYIGFIESKQYEEHYSNNFDMIQIDIHFLYDIPDSCIAFLNTVANQLRELNVSIRAEIVKANNEV